MTSMSKNVLYPLPAEVLSIAANFCYSCGKELNEKADEPKSEMSDDSSAVSANDLITEMFHRGYRYDVILHLLAGALYTKSPVTSLRTVFCIFRELKHQTFFGRRRPLQTSEHGYEGAVIPAKIQT